MGQKEEDRTLSEPAIPLPEEQLRGQQHVSSHCVKGLSRPALVTGLEAETPEHWRPGWDRQYGKEGRGLWRQTDLGLAPGSASSFGQTPLSES